MCRRCVLSIMYLRILYDVDMYIYFNFFQYIHFCHQKSNEMTIIKHWGKNPRIIIWVKVATQRTALRAVKIEKCQHLHCTSLLNIHCSHQKVVEAAEL